MKMSLAAFLILFSVNVFAQAGQSRAADGNELRTYAPNELDFRNSASCSMGNSSSCLPISRETLQELYTCAAHVDLVGDVSEIGFLLLNRYADSAFFQEIANRSDRATRCQLDILAGNTAPVVNSAWQVFETLQPLLKALTQLRDQEAAAQDRELRSLSVTASDGAVMGVLNRRTAKFQEIETSIEELLRQLPFGEHEEVRSSLRRMAGRNITREQFSRAYGGTLPGLRRKFQDAQRDLQAVRDTGTGEYNLTFSQKTELYRAPGAEAFLQQIDPSGRSLRCRFDACYVNGPRNAQMAALVLLGGATILSLGTASPFLTVGLAVGAASLSANQAIHSCFQDTMNVSAEIQRSCTPETLARTTTSQMSKTSCAVDASLALLDVALPGSALLRRGLRATRPGAAGSEALAAASNRTDDLLSGTARLGRSSADTAAGDVIVVTATASPAQRATRLAGRLERGEDPSSMIEAFGYSRVIDAPPGVLLFRNSGGQQIALQQGARLSAREADRVAEVARRGSRSYEAPGVSAPSSPGRTLASELGDERARIISAVDPASTDSVNRALAEIHQIGARNTPALAFEALDPSQKARALASLEEGLRLRNPSLLESSEFLAYKQGLQDELTVYAGRLVGDSEDLALRLQDDLQRIPGARVEDDYRLIVAGRADEVVARTPGLTPAQVARFEAYGERIGEARRALDEIPGARVPDSIRATDPIPPLSSAADEAASLAAASLDDVLPLTDDARRAAQESLAAKGITPENYRNFFDINNPIDLTDAERLFLFEQYSGVRNLTPEQARLLIGLHRQGRGYGAYSISELRAKAEGIREVLIANGVTDPAEINRIIDVTLRQGVLGRAPAAHSEGITLIERIRNIFRPTPRVTPIPDDAVATYRRSGEEVLDPARVSPEVTGAGAARASDLFSPRFTGSADDMVRADAFRDDALYQGNRELWWEETTLLGSESRSPLAQIYGQAAGGSDRVRRTVYWPKRQIEATASQLSRRDTALDSYRVVVNQAQDASGVWADKSLEMIVRNADGSYSPMFYVRRGDEWVPSRTFQGVPVERACISCHHRPPARNVFTAFPFAGARNPEGLAHGYRPFADRMIREGGGPLVDRTPRLETTLPEAVRGLSTGDRFRVADEALPGRGILGDTTNVERRRALTQAGRAPAEDSETILRYGMDRAELVAYRNSNGGRNPPEVFSAADTAELVRRGFTPPRPAAVTPAPSTAISRNRTRDLMTPEEMTAAGNMTDPARLSRARELIGEVTDVQEAAILRAHNLGEEGIGNYSRETLAGKARILDEAGIGRDQRRLLYENGVVGTNRRIDPELSSSELRSEAIAFNRQADDTLRLSGQNRGAVPSGEALAIYRQQRSRAGEYFEESALRDGEGAFSQASANRTLAVRAYAKAGDEEAMLRVIERDVYKNTVSDGLASARARLASADASSLDAAALRVEVQTWERVSQRLSRSNRPAPATSSPARSAEGPAPQRATPVEAAAEVPRPLSPASIRGLSAEDALSRARDARTSGRYDEAAIYFQQASESQRFSDANFLQAFRSSLKGDGSLALAHLESSLGSPSEAIAYIQGLRSRVFPATMTPKEKENLRRILEVLERETILVPPRSPARGWLDELLNATPAPAIRPPQIPQILPPRRIDGVRQTSISAPDDLSHIRIHAFIDEPREQFVAQLLEERGNLIRGSAWSSQERQRLLDSWMNAPSSPRIVDPVAERGLERLFRAKGRPTSIFPEGQSVEEVLEASRRTTLRPATSSDPRVTAVNFDHQGVRYEMHVCKTYPSCAFDDGQVLNFGEVRTVYPVCGPGVRQVMKRQEARTLLESSRRLQLSDFLVAVPCR